MTATTRHGYPDSCRAARNPVIAPTDTPKHLMNVLIVDDDEEFASLVQEYLGAEGGFSVAIRHDGLAGVDAASGGLFDVILLDVGLPGLDGFEALTRMRETVSTPVIMLTARGDDIDKITGLEMGADDYLPKPCNLRELVARIRAVVRRSERAQDAASEQAPWANGDLMIEPGSRSVFRSGELIPVTSAEYLVLEALVTAAGRVVSKDAISRHALGRRSLPYDRSVDAHIAKLRRKLGPLEDGRQRIKTVRGQGYLYVRVTP